MKRTIVELSKNVRISVAEWNENDISVQTQFNAWPNLDPQWKQFEVLDENELGSHMQVYRYIEDMREEHL